MSDSWFTVVWIALWLALGCAVGYFGRSKGYSFLLCFMIGMATTPTLGWIIVALLPARETKNMVDPPVRRTIILENADTAAAKANSAG